jgi:predicted MFS family arabinose efflux permease
MTVPVGLRALRHRDFRVFFAGQAVALVGASMQQIAQAWLVLSLTNSPLRLGVVGSLNFLPVLLFAIVGGAVADRLPKRRLLMLTQSLLACQTLTLALLIATGRVRYWHVCVLALVWGIANTVDLPVRQAFIVELAGRDDVTSAVALNSAAFNVARIVGPAIAGLLIDAAGVAPAYFINVAAFIVVLATLTAVRARGLPPPRGTSTMVQEIREGLGYALRTPRILVVLAMLFVISITVFNFSIYTPLFARQVLGLEARGFGLLMASVGVGAVGGALSLSALRAPSITLLFATGFLSCAGLLVMSTIGRFGIAVVALFALGWVSVMVVAGCQAALQLAAPDRLRGRIMSLHTFIYGGVFPFGAFTVGFISERWGVPWAFRTAGIFGSVALALVLLWWRSQDHRGAPSVATALQ